ncbi:MAG: AraC family transcriptional regulator [Bacilli bacterium]
MLNRSKTAITYEYGKLEHIDVDPLFPVATTHFNTRGENPGIEAHRHDLLELGYCYDGTGVFLVGSKVLPFRAGDAVIINTREVHLAKGSPGSTTRWGWLNLDPLRLLSDIPESCSGIVKLARCCGNDFRNVIDGQSQAAIVSCIRDILTECTEHHPNSRPMVRALVWRLLLLLDRYYPEQANDGRPEPDIAADYGHIERLVPALNHIAANFQNTPSVTHLASLCFMSEANFRKCFRQAMGCAPKPYLQKIRLQAATALLRSSDLPILDIARLCGYTNLSNFNRQFRDAYHCSPRECRRT